MLLGTFAHATPITSLGDRSMQNSRSTTGRSLFAGSTGGLQRVGVNGFTARRMGVWTFGASNNSDCVSSEDCSSAIEIPESQSLLLVGTGLLSMVGVLRRRLSREQGY